MKAIQILKRRARAKIETLPIPKPEPHETLVQVHYSPLHPADLASLTGAYLEKPYPMILGLECSGIIAESPNKALIGKKVACYSRFGCWSEYLVPTFYNVLPDDVSLEKASLLTINPLTALIMKKCTNGKSYLINSANSAVSTILLRITVNQSPVSIVRNNKAKESLLKSLSLKHIIDTSTPDYKTQLQAVINENACYSAFDFIGGEMTSLLVKSIANYGTVYLLGNLGAENINNLDPKEFIFNRKTLTGIHLNSYLQNCQDMLKEINTDPESYYSNIASVVEYDNFAEAVSLYSKNMSSGKILLKFR